MKKYVISVDVGVNGFYTLSEYIQALGLFTIIQCDKLKTELKESFLIKKDEKTKSKTVVKNQLSFSENFSVFSELKEKYNLTQDNCYFICEQLTPRANGVAVLSLGDSGAICRALAHSLGLDYKTVPPGTWKKDLGVSSDKKTSLALYEKLVNDKSIKSLQVIKATKNDDKIESILIGYWLAIKYVQYFIYAGYKKVEINIDRMNKCLSGEFIQVPGGRTREETREILTALSEDLKK